MLKIAWLETQPSSNPLLSSHDTHPSQTKLWYLCVQTHALWNRGGGEVGGLVLSSYNFPLFFFFFFFFFLLPHLTCLQLSWDWWEWGSILPALGITHKSSIIFCTKWLNFLLPCTDMGEKEWTDLSFLSPLLNRSVLFLNWYSLELVQHNIVSLTLETVQWNGNILSK